MQRRAFLKAAASAAVLPASAFEIGHGLSDLASEIEGAKPNQVKPMSRSG